MFEEQGRLDSRTRASGIAAGLTASAGAIGDIAVNAPWAPWCFAIAAALGIVTAGIFASARGYGTRAVPAVPNVPGPRPPSVACAASVSGGHGDDWNSLLLRLDAEVKTISTQDAVAKLERIPSVLATVAPRWSAIEGHLKLAGVPRDYLALDQTAGPRANWLEGVERALDHDCFARLLDQIHRDLAPRPRTVLEQAVIATVGAWGPS
jgi:hypothetical protein